jgi:hypothetical protein
LLTITRQVQALNNQNFNIPLNLDPRQTQKEILDLDNEIVRFLQNKESAIRELVGMGFGLAEVEKALNCSFNNKEKAIDYLTYVI